MADTTAQELKNARTSTTQVAAPDFASDPDGYRAYVARLRNQRKSFGAFQQKLAYPARPGYYRYWFNDEPGRIAQATDAGYSFVKDPQTGQNVARAVGTRKEGGALMAYLMELPIELWEEDHAKVHRRTDEIETAVRKSKVLLSDNDSPGEDEGNFYVPRGGSSVRDGIGSRRR